MIMRVYRCTVIAGKENQHREFAFKRSHPSLQRRPGLIAFYAGKPLPGSDDRTRCMVQIWESIEAIRAMHGDNWDQPQKTLSDEAREIYDSVSAEHYELADNFSAGN